MNTEIPKSFIPAFPVETHDTICTGMSLRDYFAAKAMQSLILSNPYYDLVVENRQEPRHYAADAYKLADAMLAERSKNP